MQPPFAPIPDHLMPVYRKLRITLWVLLAIGGMATTYSFLFPTILTGFDFRNPKSSRNQIFDPRSETDAARTNGKLETGGTLIANTSPLGDFSHLSIGIDLEKRSESPSRVTVSIQKNYRAFLYPVGTPVTDFPAAELYRAGDDYYLLRDGSLHRFVSETAFLSRYPADMARDATTEFLDRYPIALDFIGFRVGSLISFADGVYIVTSEAEMRPVGSAEIFLALGYSFEDVIPASEEDLGIYKRGRIFLMGAPHPDGTVFQERRNGQLYLIENGLRRPIVEGGYHDFLLANIHPILAAESDEARVAHCDAAASLLPRTLDCDIDLGSLAGSLGPDYEIRLSDTDVDIDIASLSLAFDTRLDIANAETLVAKVKARILARFGL